MKNYKSGILGVAEVHFGGKIAVGIISSNNGTVHGLSLSECYEPGTIGDKIETTKIHDPQVYLVFDSIESIKVVEKRLMTVRELFKRNKEKEEQQ